MSPARIQPKFGFSNTQLAEAAFRRLDTSPSNTLFMKIPGTYAFINLGHLEHTASNVKALSELRTSLAVLAPAEKTLHHALNFVA